MTIMMESLFPIQTFYKLAVRYRVPTPLGVGTRFVLVLSYEFEGNSAATAGAYARD